MKTVLVTGGAGFIGSALVRELVAGTSAVVVNVDMLTYAGNLDSLAGARASERHRFERVDIRDAAALRRVLDDCRPDAIFHLAAESHVDRSIDGPAEFISTNVVGTFTLLQESLRYWRRLDRRAANAFRFVHVSTDEVFGSLGDGERSSEGSRYAPSSPYAASKAAADHLVAAWHHTYGLPTITTSSTNNYGPCQFPEKLIPLMILKALAGEPMPVYGDGGHVRDWMYVDDHVRALLAVVEKGEPGQVYAIGAESARTNIEVVEAICALVDELAPDAAIGVRRSLISFVEDRPGHDRRYASDATKIRRELGWAPRETFESGLRRTVAWYVENRRWWERVQSGAYRGERLGLVARGVA